MKPGGLLVELDALLDTRLGTLSSLDETVAAKLLNDKAYYERRNDLFESITGIPQTQYDEAWKARDAFTASGSIMTWIPYLMTQLMRFTENERDHTPYIEDARLIVNIYPYEFTDEELHDLKLAFKYYSSLTILPEIVSMSPEEVTPAWVQHNLAGMILYNARDWLDKHLVNMRPGQLNEITLLMPALFAMSDEDMAKTAESDLPKNMSPMKVTEIYLGLYIYTRLLPSYMFSIYRPDIYGERHLPEADDLTSEFTGSPQHYARI